MRDAVAEKLARAQQERLPERLREGDATLWGAPGASEIGNRLGWLTIAQRMLAQVGDLRAFADELAGEGFAQAVVLGMGGSSLAPEVLRRTFAASSGGVRLHVLDSTDAATILAVQEEIGGEPAERRRTLFIVSSKSGGTIEPLSLFAHFWESALGGEPHEGRRFAAITDPGTGLAQLAAQRGFRQAFDGDPDIGGRYSALSAFGIVPAALMGVDVERLLDGAAAAFDTAIAPRSWQQQPPGVELGAAVWLGAAWSALAEAGRDKLTFLIAPTLPGLGLWLEQLVAESTGKHGRGILPVAEEPPGGPGEYGPDRVFVHLPDASAADERLAEHARELEHAGHPVFTIPLDGPLELGRAFMLAELAVATAGWGLGINPFDQPNVQQAKDATRRVLDGYEASGELPAVEQATTAELASLLLGASPPEYVAIMAYTRPSDAFDEAAAELRELIRSRTHATTTFGYGPRFLHSTGQFHKGGPRTGRFLQLLHDGAADVDIPGAPYTFDKLKQAQAIGDLQTLRELGRPAAHVRLAGDDPASALRALTATIKEQT
jgi:glucose-6-phosphate isomerase